MMLKSQQLQVELQIYDDLLRRNILCNFLDAEVNQILENASSSTNILAFLKELQRQRLEASAQRVRDSRSCWSVDQIHEVLRRTLPPMAAQEREIELKTIATKALETTTNLKVEKARQQSLRLLCMELADKQRQLKELDTLVRSLEQQNKRTEAEVAALRRAASASASSSSSSAETSAHPVPMGSSPGSTPLRPRPIFPNRATPQQQNSAAAAPAPPSGGSSLSVSRISRSGSSPSRSPPSNAASALSELVSNPFATLVSAIRGDKPNTPLESSPSAASSSSSAPWISPPAAVSSTLSTASRGSSDGLPSVHRRLQKIDSSPSSPSPSPLLPEMRLVYVQKNATKSVRGIHMQWVPDHEVQNCKLCAVKFSLTTRRHHCRLCGWIFCDNCSDKRSCLPVMLMGPGARRSQVLKEERVCLTCYEVLQLTKFDSVGQKKL